MNYPPPPPAKTTEYTFCSARRIAQNSKKSWRKSQSEYECNIFRRKFSSIWGVFHIFELKCMAIMINYLWRCVEFTVPTFLLPMKVANYTIQISVEYPLHNKRSEVNLKIFSVLSVCFLILTGWNNLILF